MNIIGKQSNKGMNFKMEPWRAELCHYGVKGMKWGVRRYQDRSGSLTALGKRRLQSMRDNETAYRKKLANITKNRNADASDIKRFEYRNQSLARRFSRQVATVAVSTLIDDLTTGQYESYADMSKADIAKKLLKIGAIASVKTVVSDALAKSASKRYTDSGRRRKGAKDHLPTKEDKIEIAIGIASNVADYAPLIGTILHMKAAKIRGQRAKYEADFLKWGGNILTEKVSDIVPVTNYKVK